MDTILKEYANKDHTDMDCFVCCILSHGNKDGVVCCDKNCVSIETITGYFRASCCPSLAGKPKLFFFQACRGIDHMGGWQTDGPIALDGEKNLKVGSLPDEADFLLGFATTSGYVAFRHNINGSIYIQTLCTLLEKYASE
ncbi:caspase-8-like [Ruditapes philippinarum]|uniref:caspase-8-like n=1 Tax=Ruditapes philippinarum TaxID=129788 RepID=UPI00295AB821|nr:caspase-8-like [Ruditapes philippinarum]